MAERDDGEGTRRGVPLRHLSRGRARVLSALLAGQLAGLTMLAAWMVLFAVALHRSALTPLHLIGASVIGAGHLARMDAASLLLGLVIHQLGPVLVWSAVYGGILWFGRHQLSANEVMLLGFFIGGVAEIVGSYLVMPPFEHAVNGIDLWTRNMPLPVDWAGHLLFGLALGGFYLLVRRRARWHAEAAPQY